MPVTPAAHAGEWRATWAASSSNPTVCRATNSRSYRRSATMTCIIPSASAASVPGPRSDRLPAGGAHPVDDEVQGFVPARLPPGTVSSPFPDERVQDPIRIADDLARSMPTDAEEAAAVRILLVTRDLHHAAFLDLDEHPAQGRVAIHRTHGPDHACPAASHGGEDIPIRPASERDVGAGGEDVDGAAVAVECRMDDRLVVSPERDRPAQREAIVDIAQDFGPVIERPVAA